MSNSIFVYNKNNNYYFRFKNSELILNRETLSYIKDNLSYPISFVFSNVPLVIIKEIINYFKDWNIFIDLKRIDNNKYIVSMDISQDKLFVPVYSIYSDYSLDAVRKRVNPYNYIGWDFKLEEVDRNNIFYGGSLYYLDKDLNDREKKILSPNYREILVEEVVRLNKNGYTKKLKKD